MFYIHVLFSTGPRLFGDDHPSDGTFAASTNHAGTSDVYGTMSVKDCTGDDRTSAAMAQRHGGGSGFVRERYMRGR